MPLECLTVVFCSLPGHSALFKFDSGTNVFFRHIGLLFIAVLTELDSNLCTQGLASAWSRLWAHFQLTGDLRGSTSLQPIMVVAVSLRLWLITTCISPPIKNWLRRSKSWDAMFCFRLFCACRGSSKAPLTPHIRLKSLQPSAGVRVEVDVRDEGQKNLRVLIRRLRGLAV